MMHPCCGYSLQKGTKLIAYIDMGLSVFSVILFGFLLILVLANGDEIQATADQDKTNAPAAAEVFAWSKGTVAMMFILSICYNVAIFYLSRFLFHAAISRDYERIHQWFVIALSLIVVRVAFYLMSLAFYAVMGSILGFFSFMYQVYSLWVVYCFRQELSLIREYGDETIYLRQSGMTAHDFKI